MRGYRFTALAFVVLLFELSAAGEAHAGGRELNEFKVRGHLQQIMTVRISLSDHSVETSVRRIAGNCPQELSTHTDAAFEEGESVNLQAGFAQGEVAAASYTLTESDFPLRVEQMEMMFGTVAPIQTTTQWSILVWEGTPDTGVQVAGFSSPEDLIPIQVGPAPGGGFAAVVVVQVIVDPGDPEQIVVSDIGAQTFSVGFRIDQHNNQNGSGCSAGDIPESSNAFPATDVGGLNSPAGNWLNAINCGPSPPFCPSGWSAFSDLGLCTPSGDWVLRAYWTPLDCVSQTGACCVPDLICDDALTQLECELEGGVFQGAGVPCEPDSCTVACCFDDFCLDFTADDCADAGGSSQGFGSICSGEQCPVGACCLPDGSCLEQQNETSCSDAGGTYDGNGSSCASANCPQPEGACCFATGFCTELTELNCDDAGAFWQGAFSSCDQVDCPETGACCFDTGFCSVLPESDCLAAGAEFAGAQTDCEDADGNETADVCESDCQADIDGDGQVGITDILGLLGAWGTDPGGPPDLNGSGSVDIEDLLLMLSLWGPCR